MSFAGFDADAVALLDTLPTMSATDYEVRKPGLKSGLVDPGLALITESSERLDADLTVAPRSSVSPLHRDLRFAPQGAARYKDHLLLTTWEGRDKRTSPTFWLRIDATRVGFASGIGFTPAIRDRWRLTVGSGDGAALADAIGRLRSDRGADVAGDQVKRVPSPYDADHPRADLLRQTGFQVRFVEPLPDNVSTPAFADWCVERLALLIPVHRWLCNHLTDRSPEGTRHGTHR